MDSVDLVTCDDLVRRGLRPIESGNTEDSVDEPSIESIDSIDSIDSETGDDLDRRRHH